MRLLVAFFLISSFAIGYANSPSSPWFSREENQRVILNVDVFLTSTCAHCQKANTFFQQLEKQNAGLNIHRYFTNQDKMALQRFAHYLQMQHSNNYAVPAIFFCDSRWTGFANRQDSGSQLLQAMDYCREQISRQKGLTQATKDLLRQWGTSSQIRINEKVLHSVKQFIALSALIDALTPCSWFGFLVLCAFLIVCPKNIQVGVGVLFLIALGAVHYLQQTQAIFFYQALGWLRLPVAIIGISLILVMVKYCRHQEHHLSQKAQVYPLIFFTTLSLLIYQQTCPSNLALLFDMWLNKQALLPEKKWFYQLIYHIFYLLPWVLFMGFYCLWSRTKVALRFSQAFKMTAMLVLLGVGMVLCVYPALLANAFFSYIVGVIGILVSWVLTKINRYQRDE